MLLDLIKNIILETSMTTGQLRKRNLKRDNKGSFVDLVLNPHIRTGFYNPQFPKTMLKKPLQEFKSYMMSMSQKNTLKQGA